MDPYSALEKAQEKRWDALDIRMLRWICGVTKLDKLRMERIRGGVMKEGDVEGSG